MINIPAFYRENMSFNEASDIITRHGGGDLLNGMELFRDKYMKAEDTDDFLEVWIYEANAYNVVFDGMSKLFA